MWNQSSEGQANVKSGYRTHAPTMLLLVWWFAHTFTLDDGTWVFTPIGPFSTVEACEQLRERLSDLKRPELTGACQQERPVVRKQEQNAS